jgi:hypothetical protein
MVKSKIFIASSASASNIAEKLRDDLRTTSYCSADMWKDVIKKRPGQVQIEALEQLTKEYDFATIILAEADVHARGLGDDLKTRDDCLLEAGFFMATIGWDRCFLLCSVNEKDLPSNLKGIILINFKEPADLTDREMCEEAIQNSSAIIKDVVQNVRKEDTRRGVATRRLSRDELLEREQLNPLGELQEDQVVVASVQPLELGYKAALQVRNNLDYNIRYVYFFQGNNDAAEKIPQLLQLMLLARILKPEEEKLFQRRRELVEANPDTIIDALKDISVNDKLNVYFLQETLDVEYCIHNATSDKFGRLYLKHEEDDFIEWKSGKNAYDFWIAKRKKEGADNPCPGKGVFHGAREFKLDEGPFLNNLTMNMRKYFPDIGDAVLKICLAGPC